MRLTLSFAAAFCLLASTAFAGSSLPMFQDDAWVTSIDGVWVVHALNGSGTAGSETAADATLVATSADLAAAAGLASEQVLGVAVRERLDGTRVVADAYVTSSSGYNLGGPGGGTGNIYKIDGVTGAATLCGTLPQGPGGGGLGGIEYNAVHDVLYVTNAYDGAIYTLMPDCTIQAVLNPNAPGFIHAGAPLAPVSFFLNERFIGIGYNAADNRAYAARWLTDKSRISKSSFNQIWSFCVDSLGSVIRCTSGAPWTVEITLSHGPFGAFSSPVADVNFDSTGTRMRLGERSWDGDWDITPGCSQVREYIGSTVSAGGSWGTPSGPAVPPSGASFSIGSGDGWASGGVDSDSADNVATTADLLLSVTGLQLLPSGGGTVGNSDLLTMTVDQMGLLDLCLGCPSHPAPQDESGCTYTQGYWENHNRYRTQRNQNTPWPVDEDTLLCGETWLDNLEQPTRGRPFYILSHQWIAASLNVANGASTPIEVADALAEGEALLNGNCGDKDSRSLADGARMIELADLLDQYNNGVIGPGHCDDVDPDDESTASTSTGSTSSSTASRSGDTASVASRTGATLSGTSSRSGDSASAATRSSSGTGSDSSSSSRAGERSARPDGAASCSTGSGSSAGGPALLLMLMVGLGLRRRRIA